MTDRDGCPVGKAGIFGASAIEVGCEDGDAKDETVDEWESLVCEPCDAQDDEAMGRPHKLPRDFRQPTKQEVLVHLPSHWPFRSCCKHRVTV